jgi:hypothetical protein
MLGLYYQRQLLKLSNARQGVHLQARFHNGSIQLAKPQQTYTFVKRHSEIDAQANTVIRVSNRVLCFRFEMPTILGPEIVLCRATPICA